MSLNIVATGNIARDPETREAGSSTVTEFAIASNEYIKGESVASFISVQAWGAQGEFAQRNFKKGSYVEIVGVLKEDRWEDKETGAKRNKHFIRATTVSFGGAPRKKEEAEEEQQEEAPAPKQAKKPLPAKKPLVKPAAKKPLSPQPKKVLEEQVEEVNIDDEFAELGNEQGEE